MSLTDAPAEGSLLVTKFQNKLLCLQVETVINAKAENQENVHLICKGMFIRKTADQPKTMPECRATDIRDLDKKRRNVADQIE